MKNLVEVLRHEKVVAIIRTDSAESAVSIAAAARSGGVGLLEVTLNTPGALSAIADIARTNPMVGAGTVLTAADVRAAVSAGAAFLVTPAVDPEVLAEARRHEVDVLCGAATPTEILAAWRLGAAAVKVFPAHSPDHVRTLLGPLDDIPLVAVGGVRAESAASYLEAGAIAVGVGGPFSAAGPEVEAAARRLTSELAE
ncbi:bifunctional 4-hydroxy-2-oxoglutarate aldolase/2-dehydro-3-deoxy-phosphogluconate aldolase [Nostocoides sp. HKS02]|uniref:bifunctional 4-hydroxy-2-oxoglutarate aldolase/2-dehydro-3-deoxy-phosphogluconate aldolase n=1 Tax=Nostocoides sp. HKS02 TaxID=1813880 RepID=UPI0012B44EDA|nr:bifunctional 4-hydroxy-2-oxoglutarate aldolase/2-dehydro-3-deoxy-phosphogluconate aldolase [Tetrasphaera sp. HKS02]QGN59092.1 hypothetical protein GKE56_15715 [Tetrasphaera sp. HKS02]